MKKDGNNNIERKEGYKQVLVIEGVYLEGDHQIPEFEGIIKESLGLEHSPQYLETITTWPDKDREGKDVPGTGDRSDIFFAVHEEDVTPSMSVKRLQLKMRWVEDVLSDANNPGGHIIYPPRVRHYMTWDPGI